MRKQTVIIDTGCANVSSVRFAVERLGYQATLSRDPDVVLGADKLFLPGVGTASEAMKNLTERGLVDLVKQVEQPLLGICLGMQMLGTYSDEGDSPVECLGHIPAPTKLMDTAGQPLPHMGWNRVATFNDHPLFDGIVAGSHFYFVHSYAMPVGDYTLAQCHYGHAFSAAINQGNYYGVQFHPERSGKVGARLIQNFLEM